MKWYDILTDGHGTIMIKANSEAEAKQEAADRLGCSVDDIIIVGCEDYNGYGAGITTTGRPFGE